MTLPIQPISSRHEPPKADLRLVEPRMELQEDYLAMAREYLADGNEWERVSAERAVADFAGFVRDLLDCSLGINLPAGWVPSTTYWLVRDGRTIVATSNLRHRLNEHLEYEGGHIGYGTRPSERRKGHGIVICRLTMEKARAMGLPRVLITCDTDNVASARIIERNGGRLENQVISRVTGKLKNRYWIDL